MTRRYINELGDREGVSEIFLAGEKQLRKNRNGNLYLQLRLWDRTGSVNALMWNANDTTAQCFDNGDYIHLEGTTQFYNGTLQIIVKQIERADPAQVNREEFFQLSVEDIQHLRSRLTEMLRSFTNYHLRNLAECCLIDDDFMAKFTQAPAAVKNHHAYHGGLLQHVVKLMEVASLIADHYPQLDRDLLLAGALFHDVGKIDEMSYNRDLAYTDEGQLIGHVVIGIGIVQQKIAEAAKLSGEPFPDELALQLKHMLLSHHGEYEFGSPKLPMTIEAITLHLLDNLDAKIHHFDSLMREDVNAESPWTTYHPKLGRKLYKGRRRTNKG